MEQELCYMYLKTIGSHWFELYLFVVRSSLIAPTQLQSTLITLKAVCSHDSACIDRFMNVFMKVIQKLHKEHVSNSSNPSDSAS